MVCADAGPEDRWVRMGSCSCLFSAALLRERLTCAVVGLLVCALIGTVLPSPLHHDCRRHRRCAAHGSLGRHDRHHRELTLDGLGAAPLSRFGAERFAHGLEVAESDGFLWALDPYVTSPSN